MKRDTIYQYQCIGRGRAARIDRLIGAGGIGPPIDHYTRQVIHDIAQHPAIAFIQLRGGNNVYHFAGLALFDRRFGSSYDHFI